MPLNLQNKVESKYGPIPQGYQFALHDGYSVLIGQNNAGKSSFLQLVFRELFKDQPSWRDRIAIVLADRPYVRNTTQPPNTLMAYNQDVWNLINTSPKTHPSQQLPNTDALYSLFLHRTDFLRQVQATNAYMLRLGFEEIVLKETQIATVNDVHIIAHGTGIRSVLPVITALTSKDIKVVMIDEPELALEARSQKVLKEIFIESAEAGKTIIIATQSHIFLDKRNVQNNFLVAKDGGESKLRPLTDNAELLDVTYNMLGNSLEDLFFPSNFLIVEGSSDQVICEKISQLSGIPPDRVKIISARGIDNVQDSFYAICNTLVPLVADQSPYAKRVVVLLDNPPKQSSSSFNTLKSKLGKRCICLSEGSLEEHIPDALYAKAGLKKNDVIQKIKELKSGKNPETLKELGEYKKLVSNSIASVLTKDDLQTIPMLTEAVTLATELARHEDTRL